MFVLPGEVPTPTELPPGVDKIMDYIGSMAAGYGYLKWDEQAKLKADMINVRRRWLAVSPQALMSKCRELGLSHDDVSTILNMLQRIQAGRRLIAQRSYRDFQFQQPIDEPTVETRTTRDW